jgi:hypothetical protein
MFYSANLKLSRTDSLFELIDTETGVVVWSCYATGYQGCC